jgi:hypothetical protein
LFFFEKKDQKIFATLAFPLAATRRPVAKVFCFVFSKEKTLPGAK